MGNTNGRESRPDESDVRPPRSRVPAALPTQDVYTIQPDGRPGASRNRVSRGDLGSLLGLSSASGTHQAEESSSVRRETRQEREARRLERDRVARIKERERSIREEHVDGGYLVTLGVYVGQEDFNKPIVRQLQIERKLAPFWRGLNDYSSTWADNQIIAAAQGLPIPAPEAPLPTDDPLSSSMAAPRSAFGSSSNLNSLTVPMGGRTSTTTSEHSLTQRGTTTPTSTSPGQGSSSSPFRPRAKALAAALSIGSRGDGGSDITPREVQLPEQSFVGQRPLEVALYKEASECPICFLDYPPYLNHTRCCDQAICSECFVQIKRPDPHHPEHHGEDGNPIPNPNPDEDEVMISESAQCPYCNQAEFGVTYEPPPFRRGLTYTTPSSGLGSIGGTAMSSSSSIGSTLSPGGFSSSPFASASASRRRAQSLSANAPNVISTDRVRPDWSAKLAAVRNQQARRAAAATALHTAAFLMSGPDPRPYRVGRFSRRNTGEAGASANNDSDAIVGPSSLRPVPAGIEPGPRSSSGRDPNALPADSDQMRDRMENLENLWLAEAVGLSLATEEERRRKAEKEEQKASKKKEKEDKKAAKSAAKRGASPYGASTSGQSSSNASQLSLHLGGLGRKRGNGAASNLRVEATTASAMSVGGGGDSGYDGAGTSSPGMSGKGKAPMHDLESTSPGGIPIPHVGPSHLRQMSNASSVMSDSTLPDSQAGSYQRPPFMSGPQAGELSLGGRGEASEEGAARSRDHDQDPSTSTEPLFNYRSLAQMVGVEVEGANAGRRTSAIDGTSLHLTKSGEASQEHVEYIPELERRSVDTLTRKHAGIEVTSTGGHLALPQVMITPHTPEPQEHADGESKQLGFQGTQTVEAPARIGLGI